MKKYICIALSLSLLITLTACSLGIKTGEYGVPLDFTDKKWFFYDEVMAENLCLNLGDDGGFVYYCQCGEPVGDSDLYDKYEYDSEAGVITLSNGYDNSTKEMKVLGYNEYHLMLEIDNEIKDFVLEEIDITSNFYSFEGEKYFSGYESRCSVVEIADGKLIYGPVNYDPEGFYENGPFEEYELAEDCKISRVETRRFNSIQGDQEYEEFYNVTNTVFSTENTNLLEDSGAEMAFLWFDEEMRVEKIVFYGETSVTADYISVMVEAEEAEEVTQEQLDEEADKENALYDAAHLNEDGSIIYLMTEEQYEKYKR